MRGKHSYKVNESIRVDVPYSKNRNIQVTGWKKFLFLDNNIFEIFSRLNEHSLLQKISEGNIITSSEILNERKGKDKDKTLNEYTLQATISTSIITKGFHLSNWKNDKSEESFWTLDPPTRRQISPDESICLLASYNKEKSIIVSNDWKTEMKSCLMKYKVNHLRTGFAGLLAIAQIKKILTHHFAEIIFKKAKKIAPGSVPKNKNYSACFQQFKNDPSKKHLIH